MGSRVIGGESRGGRGLGVLGSSILKLILEPQISSKKVKFTEDPSGFHSEPVQL